MELYSPLCGYCKLYDVNETEAKEAFNKTITLLGSVIAQDIVTSPFPLLVPLVIFLITLFPLPLEEVILFSIVFNLVNIDYEIVSNLFNILFVKSFKIIIFTSL